MLLAALLAAGVTFSLGQWQLSRAWQKEALERRLAEQAAQAPWDLATAMRQDPARPGEPDGLLDRRMAIRGRWLEGFTVLLDNRPMAGKSGFVVLTPLQDMVSGQLVLVQRGWVPRDFTDRTRVPAFLTPAGEVLVTGRIARAPSQTLVLPGHTAPEPAAPSSAAIRIRQNLSLVDFRAETRLALWDRILLQTDPAGDGLLRDWPAPSLGVEKHYGYAFQWFGLCALIAVLYVWFQLVPRFRASTRLR